MNLMTINPDPQYTDQSIIMNLTVWGTTKRVALDFKYLEKTDKWYVSLTDVQTSEVYLMNVPVLCSYGDIANNLWEPYWSKGIGMFCCFPNVAAPSTVDPSKDNLNEFLFVWGDGVVE